MYGIRSPLGIMARRYRRKRRGRRRRGRRGRVSKWSLKTNQVFSDKLLVKLPYAQVLARSVAGPTDQIVMRGNSVFDPEEATGGNQPTGYDEYSQFYGEYRVYASKMRVRIVNDTDGVGLNVTLMAGRSAQGSGSFLGSLQQPYTKTRYCGQPTGKDVVYVSNYMTTRKMWARPVKNEDNFVGITGGTGTGSNPTNQWYFILEVGSSDGATNINYDVLIQMTYWVEFSARKTLALS